jgi:hypothetical protein
MNTGVQDVQNLCWKLAAVLKAQADPALLDTYHAERQPLGLLTTTNALENSLSMGRTARQDSAKLPRSEFLNEQGLIFGATYASTAVVPDGSAPPSVDDPVTQYVPSATPGRRAPHVWLKRSGKQISTIDLIDGRFVLLAGPQGQAWVKAVNSLGSPSRPELVAHIIGGSDIADPDGAWLRDYELDPDGAVLIRPDSYVCWRARAGVATPAAELTAAFDRVLGRG